MKDFRNINVWHKAHELALSIYSDTKSFPLSERNGITSQLRRACFSIPTNIAEGCGRNGAGEFAHFLEIAMGSAKETEYLLLLSRDLGYLDGACYISNSTKIVEIERMMYSLIVKIKPARRPSRPESARS